MLIYSCPAICGGATRTTHLGQPYPMHSAWVNHDLAGQRPAGMQHLGPGQAPVSPIQHRGRKTTWTVRARSTPPSSCATLPTCETARTAVPSAGKTRNTSSPRPWRSRPARRQALQEINIDLLLGTGEVTATGLRRRDGGVEAIWALSWPEQETAEINPIVIRAYYGAALTTRTCKEAPPATGPSTCSTRTRRQPKATDPAGDRVGRSSQSGLPA